MSPHPGDSARPRNVGRRRRERSTDERGTGRIERHWGTFYRRFVLSESADPDAVKARGRHGVLQIGIGKRGTARTRRIPVEG
ncbi:MAG TPA: Hsp20/alpha crystallin family protein [Gammaproteobacteria bacterium]|nr:Hsp20/alpha crystallin family protein [Gammaproteobacteria bacterium]